MPHVDAAADEKIPSANLVLTCGVEGACAARREASILQAVSPTSAPYRQTKEVDHPSAH